MELSTPLSTGWASARAPFESSAEPHLVARAARGERGAFGLLYQQHVDRIFRFVVFRVRDVSMAEDLTQDIFISAFSAIDRLEHVERFVPWLLTIAHNRITNYWRSTRRADGHIAGRLDVDAGIDVDDPRIDRPTAYDAMAALESRVAVEDLLAGAARLTDLQHDVLALRFVAALSVRDTAAVLGRSETAVKNLQHHALKAIRRHIDAASGGR
jgi:RNA polymerase sigma-70 factor (ECF subfamily)